jgi:hypothetical protein
MGNSYMLQADRFPRGRLFCGQGWVRMAIYFAFSDEYGCYRQDRGRGFLRAHPYYARATFTMPADEWKTLNTSFCALKRAYELPVDREIKWAYLWSIRSHWSRDEPVPLGRDYSFLAGYDYNELKKFVQESLGLLNTLSSVRVVVTVTDNNACNRIREKYLYKMHLQEVMQRTQMDMEGHESNLCVMFVDPVSDEHDQTLRSAYSELYHEGDFVRYTHIKDSLDIEYSHHSVGIQLADYVAGTFVGFARRYAASEEIFMGCVFPHLRRSPRGEVMGFGIREVPSSPILRATLRDRLREVAIPG